MTTICSLVFRIKLNYARSACFFVCVVYFLLFFYIFLVIIQVLQCCWWIFPFQYFLGRVFIFIWRDDNLSIVSFLCFLGMKQCVLESVKNDKLQRKIIHRNRKKHDEICCCWFVWLFVKFRVLYFVCTSAILLSVFYNSEFTFDLKIK